MSTQSVDAQHKSIEKQDKIRSTKKKKKSDATEHSSTGHSRTAEVSHSPFSQEFFSTLSNNKPPEVLRLFIAVWPTPSVLSELNSLPRQKHSSLRWVASQNLHITLRFIGDANPASIIPRLQDLHLPRAQACFGPCVQKFGKRCIALPVQGLDALANAVSEAIGEVVNDKRDRKQRNWDRNWRRRGDSEGMSGAEKAENLGRVLHHGNRDISKNWRDRSLHRGADESSRANGRDEDESRNRGKGRGRCKRGRKREKPFAGHLTLARTKGKTDIDFDDLEFDVRFVVDEIALVCSKTEGDEVKYETLRTWPTG